MTIDAMTPGEPLELDGVRATRWDPRSSEAICIELEAGERSCNVWINRARATGLELGRVVADAPPLESWFAASSGES